MLKDSLRGIRVLDFSHVVAGPVCTMHLGDMGADVVKIEPPEGELGRAIGPPWLNGESVAYLSVNRNKRGLAIDLRHPDARKAVLAMASQADVIVESFRPGVMDRLGLGYEVVAAANARVVYCSISAYGQEGPGRHKPGVDGILQAVTGLMNTLGEPGGSPAKVSVPIADMATGYLAAVAILGALHGAARTRKGQHLDVSLYNATLMLQQVSLSFYLASGQEPQKSGSAAPYACPNEAYPTRDGWMMVAAYHPQRWSRLCDLLELPALKNDPRFASNDVRVQHRVALHALLSQAFRRHDTQAWLVRLEAADILCAPITSYGEVTRSAQYQASGVETRFVHPRAGTVRTPGFAIGSRDSDPAAVRAAPLLGEHSAGVLASYGISEAAIDRLLAEGAVRDTGGAAAQDAGGRE